MLIFGSVFAVVCFCCSRAEVYSAYFAYAFCAVSIISLVIYFAVKSLHEKLEIPLIAIAVLLSAVIFLLFYNFSYKPAVSFEGETAFTGKIISLPQKHSDSYTYEIKTESIGEKFVKLKIIYSSKEKLFCDIYDCISVTDAKIYVPRNPDKSESEFYKSRGIYLRAYSTDVPEILFTYESTPFYYVLKLRQSIINTVLCKTEGDRAGIIIGMILGDTSYISQQTKHYFSNSGASHLLAVSGLHTSLWIFFFTSFLTLFGFRGKLVNILSLIFLAFLVVLTGFSASVMRASLMLTIILVAPFFKRKGDRLNSLGFALFIILAVNPFAVLSVSLQLSAAATLGIITIGDYYCNRFAKLISKLRLPLVKRMLNYAAGIVIITVCVFVATLPIMVSVFGRITLIAPVTNLLVVGISSLIMIFGGTGVLLSHSNVFMPVSSLWFYIADILANAVLKCTEALGSLTFSALPVNTNVYYICVVFTIIAVFIGILLFQKRKSRFYIEIISAACVVIFLITNSIFMLPFKMNIKGTVLAVKGSPVIVLQSGRHYALIGCPENYSDYNYEIKQGLPDIPSTKLDLFIVPYGKLCTDCYKEILETYSPNNVFIDFYTYKENKDIIADEAEVGKEMRYLLWKEIDIKYINTEQANCVIIKFNGQTVMVSLSKENDMSYIAKTITTPNVLVCCNHMPKNAFCTVFDRIIITSPYPTVHKTLYNRQLYKTPQICLTAFEGSTLI